MKLRVAFTLPYVFGSQGLYKVPIPNNRTGLKANIRITLTQNFTGFRQITGMEITNSPGSSVEMNPDIEGIANYTRVVIDFPKSNEQRLRGISSLQWADNFPTENDVKRLSISMLNTLRTAIRTSTNNYWMRAVSTRDIHGLELYDMETRQVSLSMGSTGHSFPINIHSLQSKSLEIHRLLEQMANIPIWRNILLDSIEYFSGENYNQAVISINIAFESFTADYMYNKLIKDGRDASEARRRILRIFDGKFSKVIKNDFPKIDGRSIHGNKFLFERFDRVRKIRSHAIHSFTRRIKVDEAVRVLCDCIILMEWIDPTINVLNKFYKEAYVIETTKHTHSDKESDFKLDLNWPLLNANIFTYPEGIAKDSEGNLHIVDQGNTVRKVDDNGNIIKTWGEQGTELGKFNGSYAIVIDNKDILYITDSEKIQKFDAEGKFLDRSIGQLSSPYGLALDDEINTYVAEETSHTIQKIGTDGKLVFKFGQLGFSTGEFNNPMGIGVDSRKNIYVADHMNHRIQVFDNDGKFIFKWGKFGQKHGEFNRPHGIFIDRNDKIYVADFFNNRIQLFSNDGTFISKIDQIKWPREIFVDKEGIIYVSEHHSKTVLKIYPPNFSTNDNVVTDIKTFYDGIEMNLDIGLHLWQELIAIVHEHGDIELIDIWKKISQEILIDKPSKFSNYALDTLLELIQFDNKETIRNMFLEKLVEIVSDIGWKWYEQKTRAKSLIEGILSPEERFDVLSDIVHKIIDNSPSYEEFINSITFTIYDFEEYSNDHRKKLISKLYDEFKDRFDLRKVEQIDNFLNILPSLK